MKPFWRSHFCSDGLVKQQQQQQQQQLLLLLQQQLLLLLLLLLLLQLQVLLLFGKSWGHFLRGRVVDLEFTPLNSEWYPGFWVYIGIRKLRKTLELGGGVNPMYIFFKDLKVVVRIARWAPYYSCKWSGIIPSKWLKRIWVTRIKVITP